MAQSADLAAEAVGLGCMVGALLVPPSGGGHRGLRAPDHGSKWCLTVEGGDRSEDLLRGPGGLCR